MVTRQTGSVIATPELQVLDQTIAACWAARRPDLVRRLGAKRDQLLDPTLTVAVIGDSRQGKSQLVNALVNAPVCPVGDDVSTVVPTVVRHAEAPVATLVTAPRSPRGDSPAGGHVPVELDQLGEHVSTRTGASVVTQFSRAEIGLPRKVLSGGMALIDTPGVGGLGLRHATAVLDVVAQADAVLVVSDATDELSAGELELLQAAARLCPHITLVATKIDVCPRWREVTQRNRALLAGANVSASQIAVSAALRLRAAKTGDRALNAESGFAGLVEYLRRDVAGKADELARRSVAAAVGDAVDKLVAPLRAEFAASIEERPAETGPAPVDAERVLQELRRRSARSHNMLADAVADLVSDIEYDLRDRTRKILREADRALDQTDPAVAWEPFGDWLVEALTEAARANYGWLVDRVRWLAQTIVTSLPLAQGQLSSEALGAIPDDLFDPLPGLDEPITERFTVGQKVFTGLRGSYSGVLMSGLVTSLAGMPLINPISLGAGAVFGGKTLMDEGAVRLKRRQAAAKAAAQRYVDDFFLKISKATKDTTRRVHARLRDHLIALVEETETRIIESARAAQRQALLRTATRERRQREITEQVRQLLELHQQAQALASAPAALPATAMEISA